MNTSEVQMVHEPMPETIQGAAANVLMAEAIGAIAAIVLAVIGLAGIFSNLMASIATLVVGASLLMEGWAIGSNHRPWFFQGVTPGHAGQSCGATAQLMGGLAGTVLGILALFRAAPDSLLAVAVLVFGATLLVGSSASSHFYWHPAQLQVPNRGQAGQPAEAPSSGQVLVGLAAVVLGILAVIGLVPMTLILVGLLSLGAAGIFGGTSTNGRVTNGNVSVKQ